MKKIVFYISIPLILAACSETKQTVILENSGEVDLTYKEVIVKKDQLQAMENKLPVFYDTEGTAIPAQIEDIDEDGAWDQVAFQVTVAANASAQLTVDWVAPEAYPEFEQKTQVYFGYSADRTNEYVSLEQHVRPAGHEPQDPPYMYQFEGPGWENNLVGFRSYFDTRNGKDIFGKTTEDLVLQNVALGENYHKLQPWGLDVLKVGSSLGAGSLAIKKQDSLIRLGATGYAEFEKVAEGPVYSRFKLIYKQWDVLGEMYEVEETITLWANKRWYQSEVALLPGADTLVTGIVNLMDARVEQFDASQFSLLMTHGDQSENKDALGMALLIPKNQSAGFSKAPVSGEGITHSELALLTPEGGSYQFFFYAGWEGENEQFEDEAFFRKELEKTAKVLNQSLMVSIY